MLFEYEMKLLLRHGVFGACRVLIGKRVNINGVANGAGTGPTRITTSGRVFMLSDQNLRKEFSLTFVQCRSGNFLLIKVVCRLHARLQSMHVAAAKMETVTYPQSPG